MGRRFRRFLAMAINYRVRPGMVDVRGMEPRSEDVVFDEWIRQLKEDVICGDYGYEDGEFDVFP